MFKTLFLMVVILVGLICAPFIAGNDSYVFLSLSDYEYKMSAVVFFILVIIFLAVLYVIEYVLRRLFGINKSTYQWFARRRKNKAQIQTADALMMMQSGNFSKAQKVISKNAKYATLPVLNYIKAAEAAQKNGDDINADKFIEKALKEANTPEQLKMINITKVNILISQNKLKEASNLVKNLLANNPNHQVCLKQATRVYLATKDYDALEDIFAQIEGSRIYSCTELNEIKTILVNGLILQHYENGGVDGLLVWWKNGRYNNFGDAKIKVITKLIESNYHDQAQDIILDSLKKPNLLQFNDLCGQICHLNATNSNKLIKVLAKKAKAEPDYSQMIFKAMAYVSTKQGNFKDAYEYINKVNQAELTLEDVMLKSYILAQTERQTESLELNRKALSYVLTPEKLEELDPPAPEAENIEVNSDLAEVKTVDGIDLDGDNKAKL